MAIRQLSPEEVRDWTPEQKDRWWLENVYRGDLPQLTLRSGLTGFLLGGVLSLTNLYIGAQTGWTLGVGITSVILAFAVFRVLRAVGAGRELSILENNCSQSIATAAGYMTAPLISSLTAYMLVTGTVVPWWQAMTWMMGLAVLGVLFAFPLKRRFINVEQMPFPEGRAAGVVLDTLHHGEGREGMFQAKLLAVFGIGAALIEVMKNSAVMKALGSAWHFPHYLDTWLYRAAEGGGVSGPKLNGVTLQELSIRVDTEFPLMAAGGLMGVRTAFSLLLGAVINYFWLAPWMIGAGDIQPRMTDGVVALNTWGEPVFGFAQITQWALWCGVAMMTTASLFSFFSKPKMLLKSFSGMFGKKAESAEADCVAHIELPMRVFVTGIPLVGLVVVLMAHAYFDVSYWLGIIAIPLVFVFTLIGVNSTGLTAITPTGALGKLTQLTYSVLAPGNIKTNLMTAGITGEVAGHASNLLMDIKPGYMLGAKPRVQAIGHVLGICAGALASVPVFYFVFMRGDLANISPGADYPMPAAAIWKAVAEALTGGLSHLPESARWAALYGAIAGIVMEVFKLTTRGRFPISAVGMGLAFVISFNTCLTMALGAFIFALVAKARKGWANPSDGTTVKNQEAICAGVIAGGALTAISMQIVEVFVLGG